MVERSEQNGVSDASVDDVVMTQCFREMIYRAMEPCERDGDYAVRIERCCQVFEFWAEFLCGESVWMRVVDLDRGCLGQWDFAIVLSPYPGKADKLQHALVKLQMLVAWYEKFIDSNPGLEGRLELATIAKSS